MTDLRFIKPADGLRVHDGLADFLPAHGKGVAWDSFWQRRFDQGDVVLTTREEIEAAEAAIAAAAKKAAEAAAAAERKATATKGDEK